MGPRLLALSVSGMMACAAPAFAADTIRVTIDKLKFKAGGGLGSSRRHD